MVCSLHRINSVSCIHYECRYILHHSAVAESHFTVWHEWTSTLTTYLQIMWAKIVRLAVNVLMVECCVWRREVCESVWHFLLTHLCLILQSTGYGGEVKKSQDSSKIETMTPVKDRIIRVRFNADTASSMQWNFRPQQSEIRVSNQQMFSLIITLRLKLC